MDPVTGLAIGSSALQGVGAIYSGVAQAEANRETKKQNRYMRRVANKENFFNELEYNQDRHLDRQGKILDAEMKRMKYLDFLRQRGLI